MYIIGTNKTDSYGKTRSQQERNLRKEWGSTISDAQLDKLEFLEKKLVKNDKMGKKGFIRGQDIDDVK